MPYESPIFRLIAEGKVVPVSPEKEKALLKNLRLHYVPEAVKAQRRNATLAQEVRKKVIF